VELVRVLCAVTGAVLVLATHVSTVQALLVPRGRLDWVQKRCDAVTDALFRLLAPRTASYEWRDRIRAVQTPALLAMTLGAWLVALLLGYSLLLWAFTHDFTESVREAGSSLFTLGFQSTPGAGPTVVDVLAAASGLATVALQIGYLPTLYAAFNRRETEVSLLVARAGRPSWGPELLARTRVGLQAEEELPDFYRNWERWAADVAESHSNYPSLVRLRSPNPWSHWLVAMIAVMDSAAMLLAVSPSRAPIPARLALRMGFTALRQIADALGIAYDPDPRPDDPLELTEEDFAAAYQRIRDVGFPVERTAHDAWPHFRGWRVNYESIAYRLCRGLDVPPALWTGDRASGEPLRGPFRPAVRTPEHPEGS
jgi:hypothetical protein